MTLADLGNLARSGRGNAPASAFRLIANLAIVCRWGETAAATRAFVELVRSQVP